jgi:hypothetical protein
MPASDEVPLHPQQVAVRDGVEEKVEVYQGTADDHFYTQLQYDGIKQSIPRLNDSLARMLTLTSALSGGAFGLLKDDVCTGWGRVLTLAAFLAAVVVSAIGCIPYQRTPVRTTEGAIEGIAAATSHKRKFLWWATGFIVAGCSFALLGAMVKAVEKSNITTTSAQP